MSDPVNLEPDSQALGCLGLDGVRVDDHGMVLPHSILGSLEDFRSYLKAKGETELLERIPKSQRDPPYEAQERHHYKAVESVLGMTSGHRNIQSSALDNWHRHMSQRRLQQDFLSDSLNRPVKTLLMNQAMDFRDTQEKRELLNQIMPLVHTGCGYHEGSEFWRLPQRIGDEISGVLTTLTRTEQGIQKPITNIGQPGSLRQESGTSWGDTQRPASRTWSQSSYLQQQYDKLRKVLPDKFIKKPDFSGLEVIGSNRPYTYITPSPSPLLDKEEKKEEKEHEEEKEEELDSVAQCKDSASEVLLIPALRFCGQLATWTGNTTTNEGEVGVKAILIFEALTGERAASHLELHNEGPTAIFYSWQRVPMPHSFPNLRSQTKDLHFYFNSSSGVILPGDTQRIEFIFKSDKPGIMTEVWQLDTHPVLLQGASLQVTLRGVALFQDKTAEQRLFIEAKLEKIVTVKMCQSIVYDMLCGVRTPERPSTPAEFYITEEQRFLEKNPKLHYIYQPVEELKRLWQKVNPEQTWDLSVETLRQAVISLPEPEPADTITREKGLAELNSLLLQLSEPVQLKYPRLTAADIRLQLWRTVLERMVDEAVWLRDMLGLPERETWFDVDELPMSDEDPPGGTSKDEKSEKRESAADEREERGLSRSRHRDDSKRHSLSPTTKKSGEESKRRGRRRDESGKRTRDKSGKESDTLSDVDQERINEQKRMARIYTPLLYTKVRALMEDLMDSMCDLMDVEDQRTIDTGEAEELE